MNTKIDDTTLIYLQGLFDGELGEQQLRGGIVADLRSPEVRTELTVLANLRTLIRRGLDFEEIQAWGPRGSSSISLWERIEKDLRYSRSPLPFGRLHRFKDLLFGHIGEEGRRLAGAVALAVLLVAFLSPTSLDRGKPTTIASKETTTPHNAFPIIASTRNPNAHLASGRLEDFSETHQESSELLSMAMTPSFSIGEQNNLGIRSLRSRQPVRIVPGADRNDPPLIWVGMGRGR